MGPTVGVFLTRQLGKGGVERLLDSARPLTGDLVDQGGGTYEFLLSGRSYLLTIDQHLTQLEADEIVALKEAGIHVEVDVGLAAMCKELVDHRNIGTIALCIAFEYDAWIHFNECLRGYLLGTGPGTASYAASAPLDRGRLLTIRSQLTGWEFDIADAAFMREWLRDENYSLP